MPDSVHYAQDSDGLFLRFLNETHAIDILLQVHTPWMQVATQRETEFN